MHVAGFCKFRLQGCRRHVSDLCRSPCIPTARTLLRQWQSHRSEQIACCLHTPPRALQEPTSIGLALSITAPACHWSTAATYLSRSSSIVIDSATHTLRPALPPRHLSANITNPGPWLWFSSKTAIRGLRMSKPSAVSRLLRHLRCIGQWPSAWCRQSPGCPPATCPTRLSKAILRFTTSVGPLLVHSRQTQCSVSCI